MAAVAAPSALVVRTTRRRVAAMTGRERACDDEGCAIVMSGPHWHPPGRAAELVAGREATTSTGGDMSGSRQCRYCGTAYTTCVDGDPCCKACLHADGHEAGRQTSPHSDGMNMADQLRALVKENERLRAELAGRETTAGRYDCVACGLSDEVCAVLLYGEGSDRGCCRSCAHTAGREATTGHLWPTDDQGRRYHSSECWCWRRRLDPNNGLIVSPPARDTTATAREQP